MQKRTLVYVGLFAVAMAYLEATVVLYLRRLYGITNLLAAQPPLDPLIGIAEVGREAATLVMLATLGWAAGRRTASRIGFAVFAFGVWDIFYYFWLRLLIGWPQSLLDYDLLFLIPLPWWGPVLTPVLIAALLALAGAAAVIAEESGRPLRLSRADLLLLGLGTTLILYSFTADALAALPADLETLGKLKPGDFRWPIYLAGLAAFASSSCRIVIRAWKMSPLVNRGKESRLPGA